MSQFDIIRAWKDEDYRLSLSDDERAQLPTNPAGMIELSDADLDNVVGACCTPNCNGTSTCSQYSCFTCASYPCTSSSCTSHPSLC